MLFAVTFNSYFDPATLQAAKHVVEHKGKSVGVAQVPVRPLCFGRTYLSSGMADQARRELARTCWYFRTALKQGKTIMGLEPSWTLMFRDEAPNLVADWSEEMG